MVRRRWVVLVFVGRFLLANFILLTILFVFVLLFGTCIDSVLPFLLPPFTLFAHSYHHCWVIAFHTYALAMIS